MKTLDERSLAVIEEWENGVYGCAAQKKAVLQCLINDALKEQDRMTKLGFNTEGMRRCGASDTWRPL